MELHKCCLEQTLETAVVRPLTSHLTNHPSKTNKTCWTPPRKVKTNSWLTFSYDLLPMDSPTRKDIHSLAVCGHLVLFRETYREAERGRDYVLSTRLDDDDDDDDMSGCIDEYVSIVDKEQVLNWNFGNLAPCWPFLIETKVQYRDKL